MKDSNLCPNGPQVDQETTVTLTDVLKVRPVTSSGRAPSSSVVPPLPTQNGYKSAEQQASLSSHNTEVKAALIPAGLLIKLPA